MCLGRELRRGWNFAPKLLEAHSALYFPTFHGSTGPFEGPNWAIFRTPKAAVNSSIHLFHRALFMWLFDQTGLRKQELATGSKLESAIQESRRLSLHQRLHYLQLLNADPRWLNAVSPKGRIRWGKLICEEFSTHFKLGPDQPGPAQRLFLVTLCDRRCCTSHEAKTIPIAQFIRILRRGLRGLSYLGMIEPAYYTNVCEGTHVHGKRMVSWHLHLIDWGESKFAIRTRIDSLNEGSLLPIADGLPAAHQKRISKGKLADEFCYLLKSPKKAYRLYKYEQVTADGEIIPKFKQKKDDLRPGERLTLFRLMQDMNLDHLALAGGEGAKILRRLKRRVLRDFPN